MRIPVIFLIIIFVISQSEIKAQQFGGTPPNVRWRQIDNDSFRVIFPTGLDTIASQIAILIQSIPAKSEISLNPSKRKINIVLRNQTGISNGYVGMAPFRSELQLVPLQNSFRLGSLPWHLKLALHEVRHVEQYRSFNRGITKGVYAVLGQEAGSLLNNIAIPDWFWEGDAVYHETFFSSQGRGRLSNFFNDYRAIWGARKKYSWMKLRNGSLRDYVPDHYRLGYMLVAYGREKYGNDIWTKITSDASNFRGLIYPFQGAVLRHTGIRYAKFVDNALDHYRNPVSTVSLKDPAIQYGQTSSHFLSEYDFPQWFSKDKLVYIKSSYREIPRYYLFDPSSKKERKLVTRDISIDNYFSYRNGKIVYARYKPDIRWGWRDYNEIVLLDVVTGRRKVVNHKVRFYSPDVNYDASRIVAVSMDSAGRSTLVLIDAEGKEITRFANSESWVYTYPKFLNDSIIVSAVRNSVGEMTIVRTSLNTRTTQEEIPFTKSVIGFLSANNDSLVFSASSKGTDKVYGLFSGKLYLWNSPLTSEVTGNYQPSLNEGWLIWTVPTAVGSQMVIDSSLKSSWKEVSPEVLQNKNQLISGSEVPQGEDLLATLDRGKFELKPYRKTTGLISLHSIRPAINDPNYSIALVGENTLNNFREELSFTYNRNEGYKSIGIFAIYSGFFPWLRAGIDYTFDRRALVNNSRVTWQEIQPQVGFSIPLNLTGGKFYRSLTFGSDLHYTQRFFQDIYKDSFDTRGFAYISPTVQWTSQTQRARMQINPRFAQSLVLSYRRAISRFDNNQFLASSFLYFPGFASTNSLVVSGAFQQRDSSVVRFTNAFPFSRGYTTENFRRMYRLGVNYHLPLFYPDAGFGNIAYLLRIRANLFFDYTRVFSNDLTRSRNFRSAGAEIFFDSKWWNQHNVSFGVRYSQLLDDDLYTRNPNRFELILPVNLLNR